MLTYAPVSAVRSWIALALACLAITACGGHGTPSSVEGMMPQRTAAPEHARPGLAYYQSGTAGTRRVIFVHGTPGSADAWAEYLASPLPGFEYVAVDRPGFGASGGGAMVSLTDQAAALRPLLTGDAILVGHSLGGPIVARAAADYPSQVGGVIIVSGSLDPRQEKIHPLQRVGEAWPIRHLLPRTIRNSNLELLALEPELDALKSQLPSLRAPVYILHGTKDRLVPYENVAFMQAEIAPERIVETVTIEGGNHFLPWNARPRIEAAIRKVASLSDETDSAGP